MDPHPTSDLETEIPEQEMKVVLREAALGVAGSSGWWLDQEYTINWQMLF